MAFAVNSSKAAGDQLFGHLLASARSDVTAVC